MRMRSTKPWYLFNSPPSWLLGCRSQFDSMQNLLCKKNPKWKCGDNMWAWAAQHSSSCHLHLSFSVSRVHFHSVCGSVPSLFHHMTVCIQHVWGAFVQTLILKWVGPASVTRLRCVWGCCRLESSVTLAPAQVKLYSNYSDVLTNVIFAVLYYKYLNSPLPNGNKQLNNCNSFSYLFSIVSSRESSFIFPYELVFYYSFAQIHTMNRFIKIPRNTFKITTFNNVFLNVSLKRSI